ncbi:MAG: molecular chaperone HtpG [Actinobacteria bacterium]|nr:molecular chaperone HtpG [Actinomycetota bacterium]
MPKTTPIDISGDISIHSENILPIIKKWLYSENEIFVRELISNSFDAITKRSKIAIKESLDPAPDAGKIKVSIDKDKRTVTISDNGLGMDQDDIQTYINQIAFSGAEDFIKKYKDKDDQNQIIGHFGLGFYSSFIVSDLVEIQSLSYKKGAKPVKWTCDGSTQFKLVSGSRKTVGTDVILHLNKDSDSYVTTDKIKTLIQKYANFLPVEITYNDEVVNDHNPIWLSQPKDVDADTYKEFYKKLFPYNQEPLFWIHLNVDYPFNLQGVLYFPKIIHELDANKGQIKLFCQQVFVTDEAKDVVPEFLTLLQGAIDCPDIPLNVSRSYLQNDPYVRKISEHIVKKVADKLNELYKKERESFEQSWEDIHPFIKYGMMNNDKFYDKVKDIVIFKSSSDKSTTISEYLERNKSAHENKVIYCSDEEAHASYVALCKEQGLEVIFLSAVIDSHFIQFLESKNTDVKFVSVDTEITDHLVDESKDEAQKVDPKDNQTDSDRTEELFKSMLKNDLLKFKAQALKNKETPAILVQEEQSRRLKQMTAMMGASGMPDMDNYTMVLNLNNPIIQKIGTLSKRLKSDQTQALCEYIYDLAQMGQKPLTGEKLQAFMGRSQSILSLLTEKL